ncbi:MAG: hypothetical protein OEZ28_12200, partial [Nitrospinota bacterium]|nr:hypothetical protein [Nitrospinota bacterium]
MNVTCPGCKTVYGNMPQSHVGRRARCKKCGIRFIVPAQGAPARVITPLVAPQPPSANKAQPPKSSTAPKAPPQVKGAKTPIQPHGKPTPPPKPVEEEYQAANGISPLDALEPIVPILSEASIPDFPQGDFPSMTPPTEEMDDSVPLSEMVDSGPLQPILSQDDTLSSLANLREEPPEEKIRTKKPLISSGPVIPSWDSQPSAPSKDKSKAPTGKKPTGPVQPLIGRPMTGKPAHGKPLIGSPVPGKPAPGKPLIGSPVPGKPAPGKPAPG